MSIFRNWFPFHPERTPHPTSNRLAHADFSVHSARSGMTSTERTVKAQAWRALALGLMVASCGTPPSNKVELDAYSWWRRPSERGAFDNILSLYNSEHKDYEATNPITPNNASEVRATLTARLLANAPPSTFQANIGADLMRWSVVDATELDGGVTSSSRVLPLADFFVKSGLETALPHEIRDAVARVPGGTPYTVPVDVHRLNMLYYNTASLTAFRARNAGKSFLEPEVLCPPAVLDGTDTSSKLDAKIAIGLNDDFALILVAFESLLPALAGSEIYDDVFRGRASGAWEAKVTSTLRCVQYLSRSFVGDTGDDWADALAKVASGATDFSIMGDWSNGELKSWLDLGVVDAEPVPGSELVYVFTSDTFPLPVGAPHGDQAEALLGVIASPAGQLAFSAEKGSIPARNDVDLSMLGTRAVRAGQDFADDAVTKVLATSGLFPPYFPGNTLVTLLRHLTSSASDEEDIEAVVRLLRDSQPLFARWQARLLESP